MSVRLTLGPGDEAPGKRGRGRPSKFTAEHIEAFLAAIRCGNWIAPSARAAGLSPRVVFKWIRLGRERTRWKFTDFVHAFDDALAAFEVWSVAAIARTPSWQARAWLLARRVPVRWGERAEREPEDPPMARHPRLDDNALENARLDAEDELRRQVREATEEFVAMLARAGESGDLPGTNRTGVHRAPNAKGTEPGANGSPP